jgi:hypothetical protein
MAITTEFMARHIVDAGSIEFRPHFGDETRHHHRGHVGRGKQKPVNHVRAGEAELHRRIDRDLRAVRHECVLLGTLGGFNGSETTDMLLRSSSTGGFEVYDSATTTSPTPHSWALWE